MTLTLTEWDQKIGRHLHSIEAGADMCVRNVEQLIFQPDFDTLAFEDLQRVEKVLERALTKVRKARQAYWEKPTGA